MTFAAATYDTIRHAATHPWEGGRAGLGRTPRHGHRGCDVAVHRCGRASSRRCCRRAAPSCPQTRSRRGFSVAAHDCTQFLGRRFSPLVPLFLLQALPLRAARCNADARLCAGNGQLFLVDRRAYDRAGGHPAGALVEDVALARALKRSGARIALASAGAIASVAGYGSLSGQPSRPRAFVVLRYGPARGDRVWSLASASVRCSVASSPLRSSPGRAGDCGHALGAHPRWTAHARESALHCCAAERHGRRRGSGLGGPQGAARRW